MSIVRNTKFTLIVVAIMAFIFIQSALPADLSKAESGTIVRFIVNLFQGILPLSRETLSFIVRKTAHFTEYAVLGCALLPAVREWTEAPEAASAEDSGTDPTNASETRSADAEQAFLSKNCLIAWIIGALYSVTDEVHQYFVPGRSCELRDMGIDSCGVLAGVLIVMLVLRHKERRQSA